jgi:16S rRNA (guanine527-N7)-methyltransferase
MHPARIAELLQPFVGSSTHASGTRHSEPATAGEEPAVLSPTQLHHISTYINILLRWNARINLTAIRDPEEIVTRHFGESLFAARHLFPTTAPKSTSAKNYPVSSVPSVVKDSDSSAADLGSGAGFPGIPIKLWAPHIALTLVESNQKKTAFLREIIRALTLTDVNVFPGRAQELLQQRPDENQAAKASTRQPAIDRSAFDLITLRAVERFADVLPVAASLVCPGGRLALLIGASQLDHAQITLPTFSWDSPLPVPQSLSRTLLIARKRDQNSTATYNEENHTR